MKNSMTSFRVTALLLLCLASQMLVAQNNVSLKERGYQSLAISATYNFYNDLNEITDSGIFENIAAGYREVDGAYEILIDFGWEEEIIYVDHAELTAVRSLKDGIEYKRSVYSNGREEVLASINIDNKFTIYSDEKDMVP